MPTAVRDPPRSATPRLYNGRRLTVGPQHQRSAAKPCRARPRPGKARWSTGAPAGLRRH